MGHFYKRMPVFKKVSQTSSLAAKSKGSGIAFRYAVDEKSLKEKPEKPLYLLIDSNLRQLATTACNAFSNYCNDCGDLLDSRIIVKCSKEISAKNNAKLFHELRRDRSNTTTPSGNGWKYLIEPDGVSINITIEEYLCFDPDIRAIANEITKHTEDVCVSIERRLNRLVKQYLKVKGIEHISFSNDHPSEGDVNVDELATAGVNVRTKVYNFLTEFQRSCSPRMHRVDNTQDNAKNIEIFIGKYTCVYCNSKKINLNRARKASLFALALCDIDNLSTSDYFLKRRPYLRTTNPAEDNHANSFAQNIDTIKKQFNGVEAIVIPDGYRKIKGLTFIKPIPEKEIKSWLKKTIHKPIFAKVGTPSGIEIMAML